MSRIRFTATTDQLKRVVARAVNASSPVGLGMIHYEDRQYFANQFILDADKDKKIEIDYYRGRMVKLKFMKWDGFWEAQDEIRGDYQSWSATYPSTTALLRSEGIEVETIEDDYKGNP